MTPDWVRLLEAMLATSSARHTNGTPEADDGNGPGGLPLDAAGEPDADRESPPPSDPTADTVEAADAGADGFDKERLSVLLLEESRRINQAVSRLFIAPYLRGQFDAATRNAVPSPTNGNGVGKEHPTTEPSAPEPEAAAEGQDPAESDIFALVRQAQKWLLENPAAAQAVFSALVAEGRRFGATENGARWARALSRSEIVGKGRIVWESATLNMLEEHAETVVPSTYLEVLRSALETPDFADLLERFGSRGPSEADRERDGKEASSEQSE